MNWIIYLNGKPYSHFYSTLRSARHSKKIAAFWKEDMEESGYHVPEGELTAGTYLDTTLDHYGN